MAEVPPMEAHVQVRVSFPPEHLRYAELFYEVMDELGRAHAKFPNQHLPWGGHPDMVVGVYRAALIRDVVRDRVNAALEAGEATWAHVIAEEFFEAISEADPNVAIPELTQVMAMCARAIVDMRVNAAAADAAAPPGNSEVAP